MPPPRRAGGRPRTYRPERLLAACSPPEVEESLPSQSVAVEESDDADERSAAELGTNLERSPGPAGTTLDCGTRSAEKQPRFPMQQGWFVVTTSCTEKEERVHAHPHSVMRGFCGSLTCVRPLGRLHHTYGIFSWTV